MHNIGAELFGDGAVRRRAPQIIIPIGHHMTMIYADYFFMEAVFTLAGKGLFIW
jgi:hypothetical protein